MLKTIQAFLCLYAPRSCMNSLRKDVCNLFVYTHVRIKIYRELYDCIIYIANEGRHVRMADSFKTIYVFIT
jgi:hypothetical protein